MIYWLYLCPDMDMWVHVHTDKVTIYRKFSTITLSEKLHQFIKISAII